MVDLARVHDTDLILKPVSALVDELWVVLGDPIGEPDLISVSSDLEVDVMCERWRFVGVDIHGPILGKRSDSHASRVMRIVAKMLFGCGTWRGPVHDVVRYREASPQGAEGANQLTVDVADAVRATPGQVARDLRKKGPLEVEKTSTRFSLME